MGMSQGSGDPSGEHVNGPCPIETLSWWIHGGVELYQNMTRLVSNVDPLPKANIVALRQGSELGFDYG